MSNLQVVNLDDYRKLEDIVKQRLGGDHVIMIIIGEENMTYVPHDLTDLELVYAIQSLKDRRESRVKDT